jgi:spore coat-associated protein N
VDIDGQSVPAGTQPEPETRRRRRRLLALLLVSLLASLGTAALSLAIFTDSQSVGANVFTTGTISLGLSPASALLTSAAMMPGDTVNGSLVVSNAGTAQLRYAMSSSSTNADGKALRDQISLTIRTLGTSCAAFDGTSLFSGALSAAAFGNPAQGAQAGDRTLNAASSETLCFRASLPLASGNGYQNATTTTTFTFDAEQTANNP